MTNFLFPNFLENQLQGLCVFCLLKYNQNLKDHKINLKIHGFGESQKKWLKKKKGSNFQFEDFDSFDKFMNFSCFFLCFTNKNWVFQEFLSHFMILCKDLCLNFFNFLFFFGSFQWNSKVIFILQILKIFRVTKSFVGLKKKVPKIFLSSS